MKFCFKGSIEHGNKHTYAIKGKGKIHPRTGHEDPRRSRGIAVTFLQTLSYIVVGGQRHAMAVLPRGKRPGTHFTTTGVNSSLSRTSMYGDT